MRAAIISLFPTLSSCFVVGPKISYSSPLVLASSSDDPQNAEEGLVLKGLDQEMSKVSSKYSVTESDYLAAAKKRAEMRVVSSNAGATDEEWQKVASEKKEQLGEIDDWENAVKEAGNTDSQILMFTDPSAESNDEDGEGGGPKLLLF